MGADFLDRYSRGNTFCHRLPPRLKVLLTLAVIIAAGCVPILHWPVHLALTCVVFIGLSLAEIPLEYLARRVLLVLPLVLLVALAVPVSYGFRAGWDVTATVVVRAILSFLASLWLANVTPFDQLLGACCRLGMPRLFAALLAFMYRYLFVLFDELGRMRTAQRARTFGARSTWKVWLSNGQLLGMLLIRAMNRAERIHGAMCARGWDGRIRTLD